ncbi:hypothetical protein [Roseateles oligotrophus]|uniref:Phasin domain-containing protein n=1 Tax=Roseateles oligotrophus TaxID=1769250 RepID=A0ABT2YMN8_9BURK|nr:hypothetical protein [Roseateles oligotrophus]MCV2371327.1 hypothetical protein [Roseateles oligotrophus]
MTETQTSADMSVFLKPMKTLFDQRDRWLGTVVDAQQQMLQLQSDLFADTVSDSLPVLLPPLNIDGLVGAPWRLGMFYPTFAERMAKGVRQGYEIVSRAQGAFVGQSCDAFISLGQRASVTQSQVNGLVIDRRVSAQVINFENRRKAAQTALQSTEPQREHEEALPQAAIRRQAAGGRRTG